VILALPPLRANDADLAAMRSLRAALTLIAYERAGGPPPPVTIDAQRPEDIATFNTAAAVSPLVPALPGRKRHDRCAVHGGRAVHRRQGRNSRVR
jgi:hypothetical protein